MSAILIGMASLAYTNWLTDKLSQEERKKVELWAEATKRLASEDLLTDLDISLIEMITNQNTSIPLIVTDESGKILIDANIPYNPSRREQILEKELRKMMARNTPIEIFISDTSKQFLYYRESYLLRNLRLFPIVQLLVIFLFIGVAYLAFSASRAAEQNQVWVGMSKETAHQLGTPISSLMAWTELLKLHNVDETLVGELEKDTQRLERITERFSKIGSKPELQPSDLADVITSTVGYLRNRSSGKIRYEVSYDESANWIVPLNEALFSWVIENLCKNAIDAMDNHGSITLSLKEKENAVIVDISDTGKGIPKSQYNNIFQPGFSTKKRGWGLGLSLARRIVENYHRGKIFIRNSEINKGTTFRIILFRKLKS
ncbi:MAG TPA: HAMP domain-containing sensor histidine kinase [Prolixibacteraceae bacterium]|nr:HAMP domain-containing sensor histidine kinase [Prolixibacteraceae bacterium]